jgi:hypothetical protein
MSNPRSGSTGSSNPRRRAAIAAVPTPAPAPTEARQPAPAGVGLGIGGALNDMFSATPAPSTGSKKSSKAIEDIPVALKVELKLAVAGKRLTKAVEKKMEIALMRLKKFFVTRWATRFVKTGTLPPSVQYKDGDVTIDFVPTKRIHVKAESVEALKLVGVDIAPYLELSGVMLNVQALEQHGLMDAFKNSLATLPGMTPAILGEVLTKKVTAKETLYPDLAKIAKASLPANATEAQLIERMVMVTELVNPVSQIRNPSDSDSLGDSIEYVTSVEVEATPEEEAIIKARRRGFGDDE